MSTLTAQASPTKNLQKFATPEDEIAFWKSKVNELQTELGEFQESSRELEFEYETQIKQLETKNSEYQNRCVRLEAENEQLKSKYSVYINDTQHKLNDNQKQISTLTESNTRFSNYIRELEQSNDDLERARRALAASLEDFEGQLNQQIERNVLLESEVSEKEELECVVQRLKEEARDLRHELIAKTSANDALRQRNKSISDDSYQASPTTNVVGSLSPAKTISTADVVEKTTVNLSDNGVSNPILSHTNQDDTKLYNPMSDTSTEIIASSSSSTSKHHPTLTPTSPVTSPLSTASSARISALSLVSDLLRKVISLETKLSTNKKIPN